MAESKGTMALSQPVGPGKFKLPLWEWAAIAIVGFFLIQHFVGSGSSSTPATTGARRAGRGRRGPRGPRGPRGHKPPVKHPPKKNTAAARQPSLRTSPAPKVPHPVAVQPPAPKDRVSSQRVVDHPAGAVPADEPGE